MATASNPNTLSKEELLRIVQQYREETAQAKEEATIAKGEAVRAKEDAARVEEAAAQDREKLRMTTFEELLKGYHHLACQMMVKTDKKLTI